MKNGNYLKRVFLFLLIFVEICSCNIKDESESRKLEIQENKEKILTELNNKYQIIASLDTIMLDYTIEFQEKFQNEFMLLENIFVHDIYIDNGIYHLVTE